MKVCWVMSTCGEHFMNIGRAEVPLEPEVGAHGVVQDESPETWELAGGGRRRAGSGGEMRL